MSMSIELAGVSSSSACPKLLIRRVDRDWLGARRDDRVTIPGRAGTYVFPEEPGDRSITIIGVLRADGISAKRTAVHQLSAWADTPVLVHMVVSDETDRYWEVMLAAGLDVDDATRYGEVNIEFTASPYAFATSVTIASTIVMTGGADVDTFTAADEIPAYPVIVITPTNGTITDFSLSLNGDSLDVTQFVADDDSITVSSVSQTVTIGPNADTQLIGAFDITAVRMSDVVGQFPMIVPGVNSIGLTWGGTATSVNVVVSWRRRYR